VFFKPPKRRFFCAIHTIAMRLGETLLHATNNGVGEIQIHLARVIHPCHYLASEGARRRAVAIAGALSNTLAAPGGLLILFVAAWIAAWRRLQTFGLILRRTYPPFPSEVICATRAGAVSPRRTGFICCTALTSCLKSCGFMGYT